MPNQNKTVYNFNQTPEFIQDQNKYLDLKDNLLSKVGNHRELRKKIIENQLGDTSNDSILKGIHDLEYDIHTSSKRLAKSVERNIQVIYVP